MSEKFSIRIYSSDIKIIHFEIIQICLLLQNHTSKNFVYSVTITEILIEFNLKKQLKTCGVMIGWWIFQYSISVCSK